MGLVMRESCGTISTNASRIKKIRKSIQRPDSISFLGVQPSYSLVQGAASDGLHPSCTSARSEKYGPAKTCRATLPGGDANCEKGRPQVSITLPLFTTLYHHSQRSKLYPDRTSKLWKTARAARLRLLRTTPRTSYPLPRWRCSSKRFAEERENASCPTRHTRKLILKPSHSYVWITPFSNLRRSNIDIKSPSAVLQIARTREPALPPALCHLELLQPVRPREETLGGELARPVDRQPEEDRRVGCRELVLVRVLLHHREREPFQSRGLEMENGRERHRAEEAEGAKPPADADGQAGGSDDLRNCRDVRPPNSLTGEVAKVLCHHVGAEALHILELVQAMVHHKAGHSEPHQQDPELIRQVQLGLSHAVHGENGRRHTGILPQVQGVELFRRIGPRGIDNEGSRLKFHLECARRALLPVRRVRQHRRAARQERRHRRAEHAPPYVRFLRGVLTDARGLQRLPGLEGRGTLPRGHRAGLLHSRHLRSMWRSSRRQERRLRGGGSSDQRSSAQHGY